MFLTRRALPAAVLAASAVLATGCGGSPTKKGADPTPSVATMPVVTAGSQIVFPLDAYRHTLQDGQVVATAMTFTIRTCVARYGVEYPMSWPADGGPAPNGNVYGLLDLAQAQQYGYHGGPVGTGPEHRKDDEPHYTPEQAAIVEGTGGAAPKPGFPSDLSHDGCIGEARTRVGDRGSDLLNGERLVAQIGGTAAARAAKDARVIAADAAWSACMKTAGYDYKDPMAANDAGWPPASISDRERATATADVTCKRQTNIVGIQFGVESAYQQQLMDQNAEALKAYRTALDAQVKRAAAVASGGA